VALRGEWRGAFEPPVYGDSNARFRGEVEQIDRKPSVLSGGYPHKKQRIGEESRLLAVSRRVPDDGGGGVHKRLNLINGKSPPLKQSGPRRQRFLRARRSLLAYGSPVQKG
jgi:hypothetical protein